MVSGRLSHFHLWEDHDEADFSTLPYHEKFTDFEARGQILSRSDVYGSGLPCDSVSEEALNLILKFAGKSILDLGCGIGAYMKALQSEGYYCEGIEIEDEYIQACGQAGLAVRKMDAHALSYPENSFETVILIEVLEHCRDPKLVLDNAFRVARKNVLISVPNISVIPFMHRYGVVPWHMLEDTHLYYFTPRMLRGLLRVHVSEVEIYLYGRFAPWVAEKELYMQIFSVGMKNHE